MYMLCSPKRGDGRILKATMYQVVYDVTRCVTHARSPMSRRGSAGIGGGPTHHRVRCDGLVWRNGETDHTSLERRGEPGNAVAYWRAGGSWWRSRSGAAAEAPSPINTGTSGLQCPHRMLPLV